MSLSDAAYSWEPYYREALRRADALAEAVKASLPVDPWCPRETQPMPTVNDPGPMPLCLCGAHPILDALRAYRAYRAARRPDR
jgi:hypothetical protein